MIFIKKIIQGSFVLKPISLIISGSAKVVFLLDGSGKIGNEDLSSYRLFVKKVYKNLNIPTRGITFGLLECGSRRYTQRNILPRKIQNSKVLDLTLDKLIPVSGSCELGKSLEILNKNVFMKMPSGSPKAVVVVMAGKSVDDVSNAAKELSRLSVRVVTIGVGGQADMKQLATIADSPLYALKVPVIKYLPAMSGTVVGFLNGGTCLSRVRLIASNFIACALKIEIKYQKRGWQNLGYIILIDV